MKTVQILLIDDSELVLRHVADLLKAEGFMVTTANSTAAGLEAYFKRRPDAILADFVLETGHTGLELISAIFAGVSSIPNGAPAASILTHGQLTAVDQARAATLGIRIIQKPKQGHEQEFIQEIRFWLRDSGIL